MLNLLIGDIGGGDGGEGVSALRFDTSSVGSIVTLQTKKEVLKTKQKQS
jgi:hypothetical protein